MPDEPRPDEPIPNTTPVDKPAKVAVGFGGSVHGGAVPTPEPPFNPDQPQPEPEE